MAKKRIFRRAATWIIVIALLIAISVALIFFKSTSNKLAGNFITGNGRLEATEIDISTKLPGRLANVMAQEGDYVSENQVLARMDTTTLEAQLRQAEAQITEAREAKQTAIAHVRESRLQSELAAKDLDRSSKLLTKGYVTQQRYEHDLTAKQSFDAMFDAARSQVAQAEAAIEAAIAQTQRLKAEIDDSTLKSPRKTQVLNRLAEPGEVLPAGGRVFTVIDPMDMYMTVFLPEKDSGKVPIGAEARIVLDAFPGRAFPAQVSYVSEKSQFTPKEVETNEERQKLVFRAKVKLTKAGDPCLKPGIPGVAYIRTNPSVSWPDYLK
ncbi:MAG: HlyD family efflux transporter periplasmic adaptor subunit [Syntrophales bacterium]|jgi:HlyD family secretion protein